MIKIKLTDEQRRELEDFRRQASSKNSEKALMVLMSNDGHSVPKIAAILKRNNHTVRDWLKRYLKNGLSGLSRRFSPGRPETKRQILKERIEEIVPHPPSRYGYLDSVWTIPLIAHDLSENLEVSVSTNTVTRALKDLGYSYKRPSKTTPLKAPSKEEKLATINEIIEDIKEISEHQDSVIYALDESHFSTEPYLVQGWFKKRWPPQDTHPFKTKRKSYVLWLLGSANTKILLEEIKQGG